MKKSENLSRVQNLANSWSICLLLRHFGQWPSWIEANLIGNFIQTSTLSYYKHPKVPLSEGSVISGLEEVEILAFDKMRPAANCIEYFSQKICNWSFGVFETVRWGTAKYYFADFFPIRGDILQFR